MKKVSCIFSVSLLLFALSCVSFSISAQEKKNNKEAREERKSIDLQDIRTLLDSRRIIYETERVQASTGAKVYNVVQVDGSRFYVRCENPQNTSGSFTGVRDNTTPNISPTTGLFLQGDIKDWEITENSKDRNYVLKFNTFSREGLPLGEILLKAFANKSAYVEIRNIQGNMIFSNYTGFVRAF